MCCPNQRDHCSKRTITWSNQQKGSHWTTTGTFLLRAKWATPAAASPTPTPTPTCRLSLCWGRFCVYVSPRCCRIVSAALHLTGALSWAAGPASTITSTATKWGCSMRWSPSTWGGFRVNDLATPAQNGIFITIKPASTAQQEGFNKTQTDTCPSLAHQELKVSENIGSYFNEGVRASVPMINKLGPKFGPFVGVHLAREADTSVSAQFLQDDMSIFPSGPLINVIIMGENRPEPRTDVH